MKKFLADFIHKFKFLEFIAFFFYGVFYILRAHFIFKKISKRKINPNKPKVIFLPLISFPLSNFSYFDAILAHACRKLGSEAKLVFEDGVLMSNEGNTVIRSIQAHKLVNHLLEKSLKKSLHVPVLSYRKYISEKEIDEITKNINALKSGDYESFMYNGMHVGLHAKTSTIRYFLSGHINLNDQDHRKILKTKLLCATISAHVAKKILEIETPHIVIISHGIYSTWGPLFEFFKAHNIETVITNASGFKFGAFTFNRNNTDFVIIAKNEWDKIKNTPLSKQEESTINEYLSKRTSGRIADQTMFTKNYDQTIDKSDIFKKIYSDKRYKRTFVMYTNLPWDAVFLERNPPFFQDMFEWIDVTIEYFKKHTDIQLVIKPHPAELVWEKGTESVVNYIQSKHSYLTKNIIVLPANIPISAYELLSPQTIPIAYNSTIGLELAALGFPIIVGGRCHYTDAGIVFPISSRDDYFNAISNPTTLTEFAKKNKEKAKKYTYFFLCKTPVKMPYFKNDVWSTIDWKKVKNINDVLADEGKIMQIATKIINKEDILD